MKIKVGIVGGGASGMMAAITTARNGADVTILEHNDRVGKKILVTGNGKCNLGNRKLSADMYYGENTDLAMRILGDFDTDNTISFFEELGLLIKDKNGYLYPYSEQASTVLDALRYELERLGVNIITGVHIDKIEREIKGKRICLYSKQNKYVFDRVIIACGGKAAAKSGSDGSGYLLAAQIGHKVNPVVPALVQLRCRENWFKSVSGVRTDVLLKVMDQGKVVASERGELQLTDYGISGIPVFQISRVVARYLQTHKEMEILLDFFPDYPTEGFTDFIIGRRPEGLRCRTLEEYCTGILNKKLMFLFMKLANKKPSDDMKKITRKELEGMFRLCRKLIVHVNGVNSFEQAQVSAGGVLLSEVKSSLESKKMPGVYFAGEILDVDGKCGGYNLQWAWSSGYTAGKNAAK